MSTPPTLTATKSNPLPATKSNPLPNDWAINDSVIRLRVWGTDDTYPLYVDRPSSLIGAGPRCEIQIQDPTRRTSREHAQIQRTQDRWVLLNRSKNGLYCDGDRQPKFILSPGMEIGLGSVTLVAESELLMKLRGVLAWMLGWGAERAEAVDLALRAIRFAAQRRSRLVLVGENVVPLAEELHRLTLGPRRPFVFCNPRLQTSESALEQAAGGTICYSARLPTSYLRGLMKGLRQPGCQTQLVVCADRAAEAEKFAAPVIVPPLASRKGEIERIIQECAAEAAGPFEEDWLNKAARAWIRANLHTLAEIRFVITRLAVIKQAGKMTAGASRLGISHAALSKWLHKFPTGLI